MTDSQSCELVVGSAALVIRVDGDTTIEIRENGQTLWRCAAPLEFEHYERGKRTSSAVGYTSARSEPGCVEATGRAVIGGAEVNVVDQWTAADGFFRLDRTCRVESDGTGGFLSRIRFQLVQAAPTDVRVFVPGMIYGTSDHLTKTAIGGADTWNYDRNFTVLIREDRMPAPLVGLFIPNKTHLMVFDAAPTGEAPLVDSQDTEGRSLVVNDMRLNSLGFEGSQDEFFAVFCSPANEGEVTYKGTTFPYGQLQAWRRRYQALRAGADVRFATGYRLSSDSSFADYCNESWRMMFNYLAPKYERVNIERITDALVQRLAHWVKDIPGGGKGIPNYFDLPAKRLRVFNNAIMGFTGKNLESANFMLRWADDHPDEAGERIRRDGERIMATFTRLKIDPPEGEGFSLDTGEPALAIARDGCIYLRSFGDDMKSVARAYLREKASGRDHVAWRAWLERFGQWLMDEQRADGSFPRTWEPKTGKVLNASPWSTYNPIPFLTLMSKITGDSRYLDSAIRAGEFCWRSGHANFVFIGGTIDNPNIIDKEAGTLSLEAYLALYDATQDRKWIERAELAARYAETWIYLWNVPICDDEDDEALHWKKGLPTIGLQLIASGHSLVDMYMTFDVDEYARLYTLTQDAHYRAVAELLLHATKTMIALPDKLFDLLEEGWQQEHWSVAPPRGYGIHRGWLPWVATSHLAGIYDLKDFDPVLFRQLAHQS